MLCFVIQVRAKCLEARAPLNFGSCKGPSTRCDKSCAIVILTCMKTTANATISVDQLTAKFKTWQLYTQSLEYIRQGKNLIRLVASCRWALKNTRSVVTREG